MPEAFFSFHAELNDFLSYGVQKDILVSFDKHQTVKHLLESLGVPHTEVDVIIVNGESVDFRKRLQTGDRVDVYPSGEAVDVVQLIRLRPKPLSEPRFVLDGHLGKLATYLRLLGFDTLYRNDYDDDELAEISSGEQRILLTRDRGLLKRNLVIHGYCVREKKPRKQVVEVLKRYKLATRAEPFSRCAHCNGLLVTIPKTEIMDRLEPKTKLYYHEFQICPDCDQIYWKGSHFDQMEKFIESLLLA